MDLVIRSDAGGEFTVQAVKHDYQGLTRSIDYYIANQTQSQRSVERMGGCHRMHGKSCVVYWDKCVPAGLNVLLQSLTHPIISNPTPFDILFDRGACMQLDSVMRVIGALSCRSLMFAMPVLHVCQACHQWIKYLCGMVTKSCVVTFASRFLTNTSLEGKNRYSTETCLLMNSWKKYTPVESYRRMSHALYYFA